MRQTAVLTLVWISILGCGATQKVDVEASEKQYLLGADLFEKGALRPALEELLKAVRLNPENVEAQHLLGILALRQAEESESLLLRQNCLKGQSANLLKQEVDAKFKEAEARFQTALKVKPDFAEAWNSQAVVELHFERWEAAVKAAERALSNAIYRQPWAAQANLGWAYFYLKDYARAEKELRQAVFANPQFCVGRYRLAKVFYEENELQSAAAELEKVTGDPKCPIQEAHLLAGIVALKRGDSERAAVAWKRCVELAPKSCLANECRIGAP